MSGSLYRDETRGQQLDGKSCNCLVSSRGSSVIGPINQIHLYENFLNKLNVVI